MKNQSDDVLYPKKNEIYRPNKDYKIKSMLIILLVFSLGILFSQFNPLEIPQLEPEQPTKFEEVQSITSDFWKDFDIIKLKFDHNYDMFGKDHNTETTIVFNLTSFTVIKVEGTYRSGTTTINGERVTWTSHDMIINTVFYLPNLMIDEESQTVLYNEKTVDIVSINDNRFEAWQYNNLDGLLTFYSLDQPNNEISKYSTISILTIEGESNLDAI